MLIPSKTFTFSPRPSAPHVTLTIGHHLLEQEDFLALCCAAKRDIALIVDSALVQTVGVPLQKKLHAKLFPFAGEESSKTREGKQALENDLLQAGLGRDALLIAIGGGVTTDLVGFLASTYMRGVPLILIPTTLLAMVDAAIGGKTGLNTPFGKNLIGSFYHPLAIFIDLALLATLPQREWMNGLAEILKYGLIANPSLWQFCAAHIENWQQIEPLSHIILSAIQTKIEITTQDPEEQGLRRVLNFGHTVGHAIEHLSHFQMPHGMAVAIGVQAESYVSQILGYLPEETLQTILRLFRKFHFPLSLPKDFTANPLFSSMSLDKKSQSGQPRFVLLDRIGHALAFDGAYCRSLLPIHHEALAKWLEAKNN